MEHNRREYRIRAIRLNGRLFERLIIDPHYAKKHGDHINDDLILKLVLCLDEVQIDPRDEEPDFDYFARILTFEGRSYRLVWCIPRDESFLGVINAFRDDRSEK